MVAVGAGFAFGIDAASFAASFIAVAAIRPRVPVRDDSNASALVAVKEGLRFIRQRVWLWGTLGSAAIAYLVFLGPTEVLLPYVVKNDLGASSLTLGFVFAAGGLGAVGSAVWMGSRGQPRRHISFMYATWTLATLAVAGYGLATAAWQLMLACLVFNALETAGTIVWATVKQRHVPSAMLGRVSSLDWLISIGLLPVSFALTAPVAAAVGVRVTLVGAAVIGATVTLGALFLPGMRDIERDGDQPRRPARALQGAEHVVSRLPEFAYRPRGPGLAEAAAARGAGILANCENSSTSALSESTSPTIVDVHSSTSSFTGDGDELRCSRCCDRAL